MRAFSNYIVNVSLMLTLSVSFYLQQGVEIVNVRPEHARIHTWELSYGVTNRNT